MLNTGKIAQCCKETSAAKKNRKTLSQKTCSAQKLASTQTLGSAFWEKIRKIQNSKYETDLLKTVDCLIDGCGTVNSEFINFSIKN